MSYFKVYIINGSGGSGKDTFCNLVWTAMNNFDPHCLVHKYYTSAPAKKWASLMGWDEKTKQPMDRRFLCELKDMLDYWDNVTSKYLKEKIEEVYYNFTTFDRKILFLHAREDKILHGLKNIVVKRKFIVKPLKLREKF